MIQLKNKKILFVSVSFFNYEKAIVSKLEGLGAIVDFYDDRPSNSLINKGIVRLNKKLISSKINHYYKKILKEINQENYDYFLLIKGEATPRFFVKELKARLPKLKTIYYTFDKMQKIDGRKIKEGFIFIVNIQDDMLSLKMAENFLRLITQSKQAKDYVIQENGDVYTKVLHHRRQFV